MIITKNKNLCDICVKKSKLYNYYAKNKCPNHVLNKFHIVKSCSSYEKKEDTVKLIVAKKKPEPNIPKDCNRYSLMDFDD